jgi:hypothetical protein
MKRKISLTSRSQAAKDGWDTRTRREGIQQITSGVTDLSHLMISTVKSVKDISFGLAKTAFPNKTRQKISTSKAAKLLDML